jgi:hypothetical protein
MLLVPGPSSIDIASRSQSLQLASDADKSWASLRWPLAKAIENGVRSPLSWASTSAPCSINNRDTSRNASNDAGCIGVLFGAIPGAFTSALCSSKDNAMAEFPSPDARCSGAECWCRFRLRCVSERGSPQGKLRLGTVRGMKESRRR